MSALTPFSQCRSMVWLAMLFLLPASILAQITPDPVDLEYGTFIHVTVDGDTVRLTDGAEPLPYLWLPVWDGLLKVDATSGQVLAVYKTAPDAFDGPDAYPYSTAVDLEGGVWVSNQGSCTWVEADEIAPGVPAEYRTMCSAVHIGLLENGGCEDRNGNGVIETSTGPGDFLPWDPEVYGDDDLGGVTLAEDECIIDFVRTHGGSHISITPENQVWVGERSGGLFDLVDPETGSLIRREGPVGYGGGRGLVDASGVLWSASPLLRWDTSQPLAGPAGGAWDGYDHDSFGLCIDPSGNVWNTASAGDAIRKFAPDGTLLGTYSHGADEGYACVVDQRGDVWVSHPSESTIGHLRNDGTFVGTVAVEDAPHSLGLGPDGSIWVAHWVWHLTRIDPLGGPVGADGVTHVGAIYQVRRDAIFHSGWVNRYADMTGSTRPGAPRQGTLITRHDFGHPDSKWGFLRWEEDVPGDASIVVTAASSPNGVAFGPPVVVTNGEDIDLPNGEYLQITIQLTRSSDGTSPRLFNLEVQEEPGCRTMRAFDVHGDPNNKASYVDFVNEGPANAWERCHFFTVDPISDYLGFFLGVPVQMPANGIYRLRESNAPWSPSGRGMPIPPVMQLAFDISDETRNRFEWAAYGGIIGRRLASPGSGTPSPDNPDDLLITSFAAWKPRGRAPVALYWPVQGTPKDGTAAIDPLEALRRALADADEALPAEYELAQNYPNPFNPTTTIRFELPDPQPVKLSIFDALGREVAVLTDAPMPAGYHEVTWHAHTYPSGLYVYRLEAGPYVATRRLMLAK